MRLSGPNRLEFIELPAPLFLATGSTSAAIAQRHEPSRFSLYYYFKSKFHLNFPRKRYGHTTFRRLRAPPAAAAATECLVPRAMPS